MKVEIVYNGNVLATLSSGQTATIPKDFKFISDVIIRAIQESNFILLNKELLMTRDGFIFNTKEE